MILKGKVKPLTQHFAGGLTQTWPLKFMLVFDFYETFKRLSGPILESKGMRAIFRKRAKNGNIFENLGKNIQNLKIF